MIQKLPLMERDTWYTAKKVLFIPKNLCKATLLMLAKAEKMSEDMLEYDEMYFKVYKLSLIHSCMYCIHQKHVSIWSDYSIKIS